MNFVIHAIDKPDAKQRRLDALEAHRAYLEVGPGQNNVKVLLSGPLTADDDTGMIGSFFLVEAETREAVEAMVNADPIANANVWQGVTISRVFLRQNTMQS